jgi:hypothetical protein
LGLTRLLARLLTIWLLPVVAVEEEVKVLVVVRVDFYTQQAQL